MSNRAIIDQPPMATRLLGMTAAFVVGLIVGACILGLHFLIYGHSDPFREEWHIYLNVSSLVGTVAIAYFLRRPFVVAIGVYGGLVIYMLASKESAYPAASCFALGFHGLLPALFGATGVFAIFEALWSPLRRRTRVLAGNQD